MDEGAKDHTDPPMETGDSSSGVPLLQRIQRYLRKSTETTRHESDGNGTQPAIDGTYSAISKKRSHDLKCQNLNGMAIQTESHHYGSFFNKDDNRACNLHHRFLFERKQNISFSFNPATMSCDSCSLMHPVLSESVPGTGSGDVFALTDQNFPPALPTGDGRCIRVIRVENGSVIELAEAFLGTVSGWPVRVGTVVMISSATRLAQLGLAGYAEEFVRATRMISASLARSVTVKAGPPVLLGGTDDPALLRSLFEFNSWIQSLSDNKENFLKMTMKLVLLTVRNTASSTTPSESQLCVRMLLPVSFYSFEKKIWSSGGWEGIPSGTLPLDSINKKSIVDTLIAELNTCFAVNLNDSPDFSRVSVGGAKPAPSKPSLRFVTVGASLAGTLAAGLEAAGATVTAIRMPSWRPNPGVVAKAAEELAGCLADEPPPHHHFSEPGWSRLLRQMRGRQPDPCAAGFRWQVPPGWRAGHCAKGDDVALPQDLPPSLQGRRQAQDAAAVAPSPVLAQLLLRGCGAQHQQAGRGL